MPTFFSVSVRTTYCPFSGSFVVSISAGATYFALTAVTCIFDVTL
ncbi:hypothetical protein M271_08090 [Streptomyces rapamycinicus NRRL 5491]|nr:hypothetical protein M271_08090 [Streptomyces rapamycinicus NRRL 5491]